MQNTVPKEHGYKAIVFFVLFCGASVNMLLGKMSFMRIYSQNIAGPIEKNISECCVTYTHVHEKPHTCSVTCNKKLLYIFYLLHKRVQAIWVTGSCGTRHFCNQICKAFHFFLKKIIPNISHNTSNNKKNKSNNKILKILNLSMRLIQLFCFWK